MAASTHIYRDLRAELLQLARVVTRDVAVLFSFLESGLHMIINKCVRTYTTQQKHTRSTQHTLHSSLS